jgi:hypothetical protein
MSGHFEFFCQTMNLLLAHGTQKSSAFQLLPNQAAVLQKLSAQIQWNVF